MVASSYNTDDLHPMASKILNENLVVIEDETRASSLPTSPTGSSKPTTPSELVSVPIGDDDKQNGVNKSVSKKRKIECCDSPSEEIDDSSFIPALAIETDDIVSVNYDSEHHGFQHDAEGEENVDDTVGIDCSHGNGNKRFKRSYPSDLIVVLDMDECLIHLETEEREQDEKWPFSAFSTDEDEDEEHKDDSKEDAATPHQTKFIYVNENKVFLRPGLIEFLRFVTTRFDTHIFTAGTKEYADAILDKLCVLVGNTHAFSKRWYREDCETVDIWDPCTTFHLDRTYVKPLSKVAEWVGRDANDLRRIVHVDDRIQNFLLNHDNGIQVSGWRGDDPNDEDLSKVTNILREMDDVKIVEDVRPHLRSTYSESYLELKGQLDMMHYFSFRRTKGIDSQLFGE